MLTPIKPRRSEKTGLLSSLLVNNHLNKRFNNHNTNTIHTFISSYQDIRTQAPQTERKHTQGLMSHEEFTFLIVHHTVRLICDAVLRVDARLVHVL